MSIRITSLWLLAVVLLAGCATAPQTPISLSADYFSKGGGSMGVAMSELPKPDTVFPGADCLLCLAAASVANGAMTTAVKTWSVDDLKPLKSELATLLKARGQQVVLIDEALKLDSLPERKPAEPGFSRKDFSTFKSRGIDKLLVVDLTHLGAWRNYAAYVPTGAPRAIFKGQAYIVDLNSHRLEWYQTFDLARAAEGNWDEAPKFPGLSNAHFQVIEEGKDAIRQPFTR